MTAPRDRAAELAAFYASQQQHLERIVARHVRASGTIVEDACQTASYTQKLWMRVKKKAAYLPG
jgi:hypothetical protein